MTNNKPKTTRKNKKPKTNRIVRARKMKKVSLGPEPTEEKQPNPGPEDPKKTRVKHDISQLLPKKEDREAAIAAIASAIVKNVPLSTEHAKDKPTNTLFGYAKEKFVGWSEEKIVKALWEICNHTPYQRHKNESIKEIIRLYLNVLSQRHRRQQLTSANASTSVLHVATSVAGAQGDGSNAFPVPDGVVTDDAAAEMDTDRYLDPMNFITYTIVS